MQTRDQKYAADAYKNVEKIVEKIVESERKSYGSMAHQLPVLIRRAGLAQALSFVNARKEPQLQLLTDLATTIGLQDKQALLKHAREDELSAYILLTRQVMAALLWYKRFAQSILGVDMEDEADER